MRFFNRLLGSALALLLFAAPLFAANEVLVKDGGAGLLFSNSTEYVATDLGDIENTDTTPTAVQLDLGDAAGNQAGEARQSTKADFGVNRATSYNVTASFEFATEPITGETVDLYWSPSHSGTAGKGNMAQTTGVDGVYTGGAQELAEALKKLMYIGSMVLSADSATFVQTGFIAVFFPPDRYGNLVVHNNSSDDMDTDAIQMAVAFDPIIIEIQ